MILTATIGNRILSFALFEKGQDPCSIQPITTVQLAAQPPRTADEYAALLGEMLMKKANAVAIDGAILASVVPPLTDEIRRALRLLYPQLPCLTVGAGLRSGLTIRTDAPAELGADLVATAAGALALCKPPFLVLDCGAVTTLSAVGKGKNAPEFLGCAILPGPPLCVDALKIHAAQLPHVALSTPHCAIGTNTGDSVRAGLLLGQAAAVEGLAARFAKEMGEDALPLIATGEGVELFLSTSSLAVRHDAHLAHRGLYRLAMLNEQKSGSFRKRG